MVCFFFLLIPYGMQAGIRSGQLFAGGQYHLMRIWPHHPDMRPHTGAYGHGLEMVVGVQSRGENRWERLYNLPSYGVGFFYGELGNPGVFGQARSGFLFLEMVTAEGFPGERRIKYSLGLAHLSEYYNPPHNTGNEFIGTPWNVHFNLNYSLSVALGEHIRLRPGLSFSHFSNGAYKKPNRGLNILDVNLGVNYHPGTSQWEDPLPGHPDEPAPPRQQWLWIYSHGLMQRAPGDPRYHARTITLNYTRSSGLKNRWGGGVDIFWDDHAREETASQTHHMHFYDYMRTGLFVSHDILFGRLSVLINLGTYVYAGHEPDQPLYQRIGLRVALGRHIVANLSLKARFLRADYAELGLGLAF